MAVILRKLDLPYSLSETKLVRADEKLVFRIKVEGKDVEVHFVAAPQKGRYSTEQLTTKAYRGGEQLVVPIVWWKDDPEPELGKIGIKRIKQ